MRQNKDWPDNYVVLMRIAVAENFPQLPEAEILLLTYQSSALTVLYLQTTLRDERNYHA